MISIVVPIYNSKKNILQLISSIQKQTYEDWELILIDDGSIDNSLTICKQIAVKDVRIKVIHQENQGPSVARNVGIRAAKGEWITFVDADDGLLDCFLESMINVVKNSKDIDVVFAGYLIVESRNINVFTYDTVIYNGVKEIRKAITETNLLHRCCPWGKMFRRSVMVDNLIVFDEQLSHSEDRLFFYDFLIFARGMATTSSVGYLYDSTQSGTLKSKVLTPQQLALRQYRLAEAANRLIQYFDLNGEELFSIAKHLLLLFSNAIQNLYYALGKGKETIACQRDFYRKFFDEKMYMEVRECSKWGGIESSNYILSLAIHQEFKKMNEYLANVERKIEVYKILNKFLRKQTFEQDFFNVIKFLNR